MLQHKLFSVTFVKQYGDRVSPIKVMVNPSFKGEYHYQGNKALVLEGILEWSLHHYLHGHKILLMMQI